jgi:hypothetical protein
LVLHPYPVTPYHADYLEEFDLARRAQLRFAGKPAGADTGWRLKILAKGHLAETLVPATWKADAHDWDATLEEIDVATLAAYDGRTMPWGKQGWFQAHRLYADLAPGNAARLRAQQVYRRLMAGEYSSDIERINLQRALVTMLVAGCERVVVGYTLRHEFFNTEYSSGVEDVAFDSQAGLLSSIFPRSVKLKDFPWNGWLRVGVPAKPSSAWNPIAGFSDAFSRLVWLTIADPALLQQPYGSSWIANRASIADATTESSPIAIPATALKPQLGTGLLLPVGAGKLAQQKLRYSVVTSTFHDGTAAGVADILYPYIFAFRWDEVPGGKSDYVDPFVARSTALARDWLAGVEVIGIETQTRDYGGDLKFSYRVPVVDVYLNRRTGDPWLAAAVAPPWSTLPWELMVLMEEAVTRGVAAFSDEQARRRGIPWLDLVRDRDIGARLATLVEEFRQAGYRPEPLKQLVTEQEARDRWTALARFYSEHGHFLVTNGPYRLDSWTADSAVLQVFRDPSYPLGVGTFDSYAIPLKGYVSVIDDQGDQLTIRADVERVVTTQRSYEIERVPLASTSVDTDHDERQECRYVIVAPAGNVVQAGTAPFGGAGQFAIDLKQLGPSGTYTIVAAVLVGGSEVNPEVKLVEHRVVRVAAPPRPGAHPG